MGMSAGQARLLSITARLTDNELRSQTITNSKNYPIPIIECCAQMVNIPQT